MGGYRFDIQIIYIPSAHTLTHQGLALPGLPDFNVYIPDVKRSGYFVSLRYALRLWEWASPSIPFI